MDQETFINNFAQIFDEVAPSDISMDMPFRDIEEWSSMAALGLLAMVEEEYGVRLNNQDIKTSNTIADLYHIVESKKS